jgi:hypothetical protein
MSAKRFGAVYFNQDTAQTWLGLMSGEEFYDKTAVVNICNQSNEVTQVSLAYIVDPDVVVPKQEDFLLFYKQLNPLETFRYESLAVASNARIAVWSLKPGVSVVAFGYQDEI